MPAKASRKGQTYAIDKGKMRRSHSGWILQTAHWICGGKGILERVDQFLKNLPHDEWYIISK